MHAKHTAKTRRAPHVRRVPNTPHAGTSGARVRQNLANVAPALSATRGRLLGKHYLTLQCIEQRRRAARPAWLGPLQPAFVGRRPPRAQAREATQVGRANWLAVALGELAGAGATLTIVGLEIAAGAAALPGQCSKRLCPPFHR
jgi:hypothetical protein